MVDNDKRRYTRVPFDADVLLEPGAHRGELVDISLKGLLVNAPAGWSGGTGTACVAVLELGDDVAIRMDCTVMHLTGDRAGLRIDRIDMESLMHLRRLLELNLGDPELFERELSGLHG